MSRNKHALNDFALAAASAVESIISGMDQELMRGLAACVVEGWQVSMCFTGDIDGEFEIHLDIVQESKSEGYQRIRVTTCGREGS